MPRDLFPPGRGYLPLALRRSSLCQLLYNKYFYMYLADPTTRTLTEEILVIPTVLTRTRPQSINFIRVYFETRDLVKTKQINILYTNND